jgi:GcrA cell cycle regulator
MRKFEQQHSETPASWTDERVELLKKYLHDGLSSSVIAMRLGGITRNAVIGKISRLGLRTNNRPGHQPKFTIRQTRTTERGNHVKGTRSFNKPGIQQMAEIAEKTRDCNLLLVASPLPAPSCQPGLAPLNLHLLDLLPHHCRYAVNNADRGEPHLFCGHERIEGSPYCSFHHSRCYAGVSTRRPALPMRRAA